MANRFLKIAVVYLMIGSAMGLILGVTHRFEYAPVHAHINLLGWASMALVGLIYHVHPEAERTRLAQAHFWLHNIGLPLFMVSLFLTLSGSASAQRGVAIGAVVTLVGIQIFAVNLLRVLGTRALPRASQPASFGQRGLP